MFYFLFYFLFFFLLFIFSHFLFLHFCLYIHIYCIFSCGEGRRDVPAGRIRGPISSGCARPAGGSLVAARSPPSGPCNGVLLAVVFAVFLPGRRRVCLGRGYGRLVVRGCECVMTGQPTFEQQQRQPALFVVARQVASRRRRRATIVTMGGRKRWKGKERKASERVRKDRRTVSQADWTGKTA